MLSFKEFLAEKEIDIKIVHYDGDTNDLTVLVNPSFNKFMGLFVTQSPAVAGFVDNAGKIVCWESPFTLHKDVVKAMKIKVKKSTRFRVTMNNPSKFIFTPSEDTTGLSISKLAAVQKMMNGKKRPYIVFDDWKDKAWIDGKKVDPRSIND